MRGAPDIGSISLACEVETTRSGKFRGRLAVPYEGTRLTDEYDVKSEAQAALKVLHDTTFPAATPFAVLA